MSNEQGVLTPIMLPRRVGAFLIDFLLCISVSEFIKKLLDFNNNSNYFILFAVYIFYILLTDWNGSLGKRIFKMQVCTIEGEPMKKKDHLNRCFFKSLNFLSLNLVLIFKGDSINNQFGLSIITGISILVNMYFYYQGYSQVIHDYLSKTIVVKK